mmetsp:Transcript_100/g.290  ORF Transcript_100/g.290 Transcript_100/m.290 type:complete len:583 (+) Transcript_100:244-1992(+)|eukprot:CAMPEP_0198731770 /NCGR_PEP_ID=MMETSP1475-20131203/32049_1 /TAXON_ID= ORGANISM="Unidentified sp., Strain CCMP1999" /NCGR_SAMPLE_ID=MMETSP1475 /ASSEMBLY_ACC=CAM_ASM_001111 /LENGTH=582 /DNA_ID=CAMNT_0044494775 /DNA_START=238 /DNA_END=1989 /DNA_ORIENTATION=-
MRNADDARLASSMLTIQEYGDLLTTSLAPLKRLRGGVDRVAVWVNGSAASIALAILTSVYFKENALGRVVAVITPSKVRGGQLPFRHLQEDFRIYGVDAVQAEYRNSEKARSIRATDSVHQLPYVLREMVKLQTKTLLSWHTKEHDLFLHVASLCRRVPSGFLDGSTEMERLETAPKFLRGGYLPQGCFDIVRPFLELPSELLRNKCRDYGINPVGLDEDLCSQIRFGKQIVDKLDEETKRKLLVSRKLYRGYLREHQMLSDSILRDSVFETNSQGLVVLKRKPFAKVLGGKGGLQNVAVSSLQRLIRNASGAKQQAVHFGRVKSVAQDVFLDEEPKRTIFQQVLAVPLEQRENYVRRANEEVLARNLVVRPKQTLPSQIKDADLVAIYRHRGSDHYGRALLNYSLMIGLNELKMWDRRFLVGVFPKPPDKLEWPGHVHAKKLVEGDENEEKESNERVQYHRATAADALTSILDLACNDALLDREVREPVIKVRSPFVVKSLQEHDIKEICERHPEIKGEILALPRPLLWSVPCFRRFGEMLSVPTLGINYEPKLTFEARLLQYPPYLPKDLDPSYRIDRWL